MRREILAVSLLLAALAGCGDDGRQAVRETEAAEVPTSVPSGPVVAQPAGDAEAQPAVPDDETLASASPSQPVDQPAPAVVPSEEQPSAPEGQAQVNAASILRRAETAYDAIRSLEADFTQELTVPLLGSTQRSRGKMFILRPDRFLMRFTDPAGDIVVADGRYLWLYYPSTDAKQVMRAPVAAAGQSVDLQKEFLSNPTERFDAVLNGTETVAGRNAYALTLTPRAASGYRRVRIWVDAQDALVRRFEITESNESVRKLELANLRPNATVAASLFQFTPPAGAQVFTQ